MYAQQQYYQDNYAQQWGYQDNYAQQWIYLMNGSYDIYVSNGFIQTVTLAMDLSGQLRQQWNFLDSYVSNGFIWTVTLAMD